MSASPDGGFIPGTCGPIRVDPNEETMTAAEVRAYPVVWHYVSPEPCDHPVTVTNTIQVADSQGHVVAHTTEAMTWCLQCREFTFPDIAAGHEFTIPLSSEVQA